MKLIERHIIKPDDKRYKEIRLIMHLSKNLYNAGLYMVRQYFLTKCNCDSLNTVADIGLVVRPVRIKFINC